MRIGIEDGKHFGNIVDAVDQRLPGIEGPRAKRLTLAARRRHIVQTAPQSIVDQVFLTNLPFALQPLKLRCNVVIDCQSGFHTSRHKLNDVLRATSRRLRH
jgi:hypothetical protein